MTRGASTTTRASGAPPFRWTTALTGSSQMDRHRLFRASDCRDVERPLQGIADSDGADDEHAVSRATTTTRLERGHGSKRVLA